MADTSGKPQAGSHIRDERPQRLGWAPGGYSGRCRTCEEAYTGDKRSWQCAPCAYNTPDPAPIPEPLASSFQFVVRDAEKQHWDIYVRGDRWGTIRGEAPNLGVTFPHTPPTMGQGNREVYGFATLDSAMLFAVAKLTAPRQA